MIVTCASVSVTVKRERKLEEERNNTVFQAQEDDGVTEYLYKILVVGDIGTGKTSIIKRFVHNIFSMHYKSTVSFPRAPLFAYWPAHLPL